MAQSIWQAAGLSQLDEAWLKLLQPCLQSPPLQALAEFLQAQLEQEKSVFPAQKDWFNAFALTPFKQVKVVVLGQDPYHSVEQGQPQAHGLSFSVNQGVKIPPSLRNMLKELASDLDVKAVTHGDLTQWAQQGVLLLNSVLTVAQGQAGAHHGQGWEQLTDTVITELSNQRSGIVFMLWGKQAQQKAQLIDADKHLILTAVHPSPLSAHRGFFGCRHFSLANAYLQAQGTHTIDWQRTPVLVEPSQIQLL